MKEATEVIGFDRDGYSLSDFGETIHFYVEDIPLFINGCRKGDGSALRMLTCYAWWTEYFGIKGKIGSTAWSKALSKALEAFWRTHTIDEILGYECIDDSCHIVAVKVECDCGEHDAESKMFFVLYVTADNGLRIGHLIDNEHPEYVKFDRVNALNVLRLAIADTAIALFE